MVRMIWSGNGHLSAFRADGQQINGEAENEMENGVWSTGVEHGAYARVRVRVRV